MENIIRINRETFLMPTIITAIMSLVQTYGLIITDSPYKVKVILLSAIMLLIWIVLFIHSKKEENMYADGQIVVITATVITSVLIAIVFSCTIWGKGYLSLSPIDKINTGQQHRDTLFHSAIAESLVRGKFPSALVNEEDIIYYHTFSHFVVGLIARFVALPAFFVYNHIYPILFLPIYIFAQIISIKSAKSFFVQDSSLQLEDILIISIYNIGIIKNTVLNDCGIWKFSYIGSESFLMANTLAFLGYAILFTYLRKETRTEKLSIIFVLFEIPAMILMISWAKISIGFLFTASVMYYVARKYWRSRQGWGLNIFYGLIFLLALYLFNRGEGFSGSRDLFRLYAFKDYCNGMRGFIGHYLILFFIGGLAVFLDCVFNKYSFRDIIGGKTLWVEEIFVVCILGFLPGFFIKIEGGSAAYFSYAVETLTLVLLCGRGYMYRLLRPDRRIWKVAIIALLLARCAYIGINNSITIIKDNRTVIGNCSSEIYSDLMKFRVMVAEEPEKYTFYLNKDANVTKFFESSIGAVFVYPGITGVGVINASYYSNGKWFMFDDTEALGYGLTSIDSGKLSYEEALVKAKELGKKYVIHVLNNGYKIDNIDD